MSILTTCGSTSGGGGLPVGMLRLIACSWIGSVMISMTKSTSMTSISGVVLISIMTSGSAVIPGVAEPIAIVRSSVLVAARQVLLGGGSVMKPTLAMPARWHA